jgi:hypothetical protein
VRAARSVIAEVAIALVLLVGAGLVTRSFAKLMSVDPGYRVDHVLTVPIDLPRARYPDAGRVITFYRELSRRVAALPGVTATGGVAGVPLVAPRGDLGINIEGRPVAPGEQRRRADWQVVTPGYFKAMGMRLLRGRAIEDTDLEASPGVVVINETLTKKYWPADDPIGKRFTLGGGAGPGMVTIVGIVADVRQSSLAATPEAEMYLAHTQFRFWGGGGILSSLSLVLRTTGEPSALSRVVRGEIASVDPQLPVGEFRTMEQVRGESVSQPRFLMFLFSTVLGGGAGDRGDRDLRCDRLRRRAAAQGDRDSRGVRRASVERGGDGRPAGRRPGGGRDRRRAGARVRVDAVSRGLPVRGDADGPDHDGGRGGVARRCGAAGELHSGASRDAGGSGGGPARGLVVIPSGASAQRRRRRGIAIIPVEGPPGRDECDSSPPGLRASARNDRRTTGIAKDLCRRARLSAY